MWPAKPGTTTSAGQSRRLARAAKLPVAQSASNTGLSVYTNVSDGLRRRFESGAAYVSLINVAYRRETISNERRLVALLALSDLAKATEEDLQSLTPPGIATTDHFRLLNVLDSHAVAARQYWQATVRPTADTVDAGSRHLPLQHIDQQHSRRLRPGRAMTEYDSSTSGSGSGRSDRPQFTGKRNGPPCNCWYQCRI